MKCLLSLILLIGCAHTQTDHEERVERINEAKARHKAEWDAANARTQARVQAENAAMVERTNALIEQRKRDEQEARDSKKAAEYAALVDQCEQDRDGRRKRLDEHLKSYEERNKLLEWEEKHCKVVDRGKPVVREYEQTDGTLIRKRIISGYPERECDAPEPKGLPKWRIGTTYRKDGLVRLSREDDRLNEACVEIDLAAGWDHVDRDE